MTSNLKDVNDILDENFDQVFNIQSFMYSYVRPDKDFVIGRFAYFFLNHYGIDGSRRQCGEYFEKYYNNNGKIRLYEQVEAVCNIAGINEMRDYMDDIKKTPWSFSNPNVDGYGRCILKQHIEETYIDYIYLYFSQTKYPEFIKQIEHYCDAEAQPKKTYENEHIE